jgi:hypothetical protein
MAAGGHFAGRCDEPALDRLQCPRAEAGERHAGVVGDEGLNHIPGSMIGLSVDEASLGTREFVLEVSLGEFGASRPLDGSFGSPER